MHEADSNSLYLGLPSTMGRNKSVLLGYLKDKMNRSLLSCEGKFLSRACKEELCKIVAHALPTYAMNVFLLPIEISWE